MLESVPSDEDRVARRLQEAAAIFAAFFAYLLQDPKQQGCFVTVLRRNGEVVLQKPIAWPHFSTQKEYLRSSAAGALRLVQHPGHVSSRQSQTGAETVSAVTLVDEASHRMYRLGIDGFPSQDVNEAIGLGTGHLENMLKRNAINGIIAMGQNPHWQHVYHLAEAVKQARLITVR